MEATERTRQRDAALELANEIRAERKRLRIKIHNMPRKKACNYLARAVDNPPRALASVKTAVAIGWVWGIGKQRTQRFLRHAGVLRGDTELQDLTDGERLRLRGALKRGI